MLPPFLFSLGVNRNRCGAGALKTVEDDEVVFEVGEDV